MTLWKIPAQAMLETQQRLWKQDVLMHPFMVIYGHKLAVNG